MKGMAKVVEFFEFMFFLIIKIPTDQTFAHIFNQVKPNYHFCKFSINFKVFYA